MYSRVLKLMILLTLGFASCADPAANKPKAVVQNSNTEAAQAEPDALPAKPETKGKALKLDSENSRVNFVGSKVTGKHEGGFTKLEGFIDLVENKPEKSSVYVEIDTQSIFSDNNQLTEHLKSADFFDVQKFPKAYFRSKEIVAQTEAQGGNYMITGDLWLHGRSRTITFPAKITINSDKVSVEAEFSINRKEFGMIYPGKADDLIRDDVVIKLDLGVGLNS
jgi:polyisoprenoid-binding protein YceI